MLLVLAAPALALAQSASITMDGPVRRLDAGPGDLRGNNAPRDRHRPLSMQVTNDEHYLYVKLVVGSRSTCRTHPVPHGICLFIDGDNNSTTGNVPQSPYGRRCGSGSTHVPLPSTSGTSSNVSWSNLDLVPLPTTTGTTFEIAIARNAKPGGVNDLFTSNTIKLLFTDLDNNDRMPNTGSPAFTYTFDPTPTPPLTPIDLARVNGTDVRVTTWNVLADGITDANKQPAFHPGCSTPSHPMSSAWWNA